MMAYHHHMMGSAGKILVRIYQENICKCFHCSWNPWIFDDEPMNGWILHFSQLKATDNTFNVRRVVPFVVHKSLFPIVWSIVHPNDYAHGPYFVVLCRGVETLVLPIYLTVAYLFAPGRYGRNFKSMVFKVMMQNTNLGSYCEIALRWIP